ncbi:MAG: SLC45 family MFS transporter [Ruminococcaceae bacterium]|nr:SLC45 family MFS transporter [Oscillospiraceae bacterium]
MKLNTKRTVFVGFAFFLICMFWQAYDVIIPKILTDKFGMPQSLSGIVMALDNVLALFLLPLFGTLSDKTHSRFGKRTPFIVVGTLVAAASLLLLSRADAIQTERLQAIDTLDRAALVELYDADLTISLADEAGTVKLSDAIAREDFLAISDYENDGYTKYVIPARQAYAARVRAENPATLFLFIGVLFVLLVAMGTFRSPAVALMPDVTPKPLRSKANAIINLMGALGGILVLVLGIVFGTGKDANALMRFGGYFGVIAAVMVGALAVFLLFVREKRWTAELAAIEGESKVEEKPTETASRKLSRAELRSLLLILASSVLWYMGYNAVTSKYSVYAGQVLNLDYNTTLTIASAAAIVSYIPVGAIASKVGRKKCILVGVAMLAVSFGAATFIREGANIWLVNALFALAGIGWATINVNSYPMVVELSRDADIGRYTGFYYTATMAAQTVTPILSGIFMDIRFTLLFPYATVFVVGALFTMLFVKHGDNKPEAKKGVEAFDALE